MEAQALTFSRFNGGFKEFLKSFNLYKAKGTISQIRMEFLIANSID